MSGVGAGLATGDPGVKLEILPGVTKKLLLRVVLAGDRAGEVGVGEPDTLVSSDIKR